MTYILNGIDTTRYVYTGGQWGPDNDLSSCSTNVCHKQTRPYYCLTEDGSVYLTTPDGVIYYLAAGNDTMQRIYPLNTKITAEISPPGFDGLRECDVSSSAISICWTNPNEVGVTYAQIIRPTHGNIVPWRPGDNNCIPTLMLDGTNVLRSFVSPNPSMWVNPKYPHRMLLPYCNGYYVIQTGDDHCVVFYKGTLIYEGKYSGQGIPAKFAYGTAYCGESALCCPLRGSAKWTYQMFPEWETDGKHNILAQSAENDLLSKMGVNMHGDITFGNIVRTDSATVKGDKCTYTMLNYIANDRKDEYIHKDLFMKLQDSHRLCAVFKGQTSTNGVLPEAESNPTCIGYISVSSERNITNMTGHIDKYISEEEFKKEHDNFKDKIKDMKIDLDIIKRKMQTKRDVCIELGLNVDHPKELKTQLEAQLHQIEEDLEKENEVIALNVKLAALDGYIPVLENYMLQRKELVSAQYTDTLLDTIEIDPTTLASLVGCDVIWQISKNKIWDNSISSHWAERLSDLGDLQPVPSCSYVFFYTLTEKESLYPCEGGAAPIRYKTWYEGTDRLASDSDSRYKLSTWMEECCSIQYPSERGKGVCSKYKCAGGNSPCTPPEECGTNYPITSWRMKDGSTTHGKVTDGYGTRDAEPTWLHLAPNECDIEWMRKLARDLDNLCTTDIKVENKRICAAGYCTTLGAVKRLLCPPDPTNPETPEIIRSVSCISEVATTAPENLGGRIQAIYGSTNDLTGEREVTNWALIVREQPSCRITKDYTVLGSLNSPEQLPGILELNGEDVSSAELDGMCSRAVVLRAPASKSYDGNTDPSAGFILARDPLDVKEKFTRFFPAYLTRPGFDIPITPIILNDEHTYYNIYEGIYPEPPDENTPNSDGEIWKFDGFQYVDLSVYWYVRWKKYDTALAVNTRLIKYKASLFNMNELWGQEETDFYIKKEIELWLADNVGHEEDLIPDVRPGHGIDSVDITVLRAMPKPKGRVCSKDTEQPAGGVWYCRGVAVSKSDIWDPSTWDGSADAPVDPNVVYTQMSGIWWKQGVITIGDPAGLPIRCGLQQGDLFYNRAFDSLVLRAAMDASDYDIYWYWTGYQWCKGHRSYSDLNDTSGIDCALFYKDKGAIDLRPIKLADGTYESCGQARALFIGKITTYQACGDLLGVNIGAQSYLRKALFLREKELWSSDATGRTYLTTNGSEMKESMHCLGNIYTLVALNTSANKQTFYLWYQGFPDYNLNNQNNDRTKIANFTTVFEYEDVPDIDNCYNNQTTAKDIIIHGEEVMKHYLIIPSRNGELLYVFYKGVLVHTYTDNSTSCFPKGVGGVCGPRYAIITRPGGVCDIWRDGVLFRENVACRILLNGAIVVATLWNGGSGTKNSPGTHSIYTSAELAIMTDTGEEYIWASCSDSFYPHGPSHSINCDMLALCDAGPNTLYMIGNCSAAASPPATECDPSGDNMPYTSWGATWAIYLYNSATQKMSKVGAQAGKMTEMTGTNMDSGTIPCAYGDKCDDTAKNNTHPTGVIEFTNFVEAFVEVYNDSMTVGIRTCSFSYSTTDGAKESAMIAVMVHTITHPTGATEDLSAYGAYAIWSTGNYHIADTGWVIETCGDRHALHRTLMCCNMNDVGAYISITKTHRVGVTPSGFVDETIGNTCICNYGTRCGDYTHYDAGESTPACNTYKGVSLENTSAFAPNGGCCGDAPYALFANGELYYRSLKVATLDPTCRWVSCCGNAAVLRTGTIDHKDGTTQYLFIEGVQKDTWADNYDDFDITCCGYDYYVIQRGSFQFVPNTLDYGVVTEHKVVDGVDGSFIYERCLLGQGLSLKNWAVATLEEKQVYCCRSEEKGGVANKHREYRWYERPKTWAIKDATYPSVGDATLHVPHDFTYTFGAYPEDGEDSPNIENPDVENSNTATTPHKIDEPNTWPELKNMELIETRIGYIPWQREKSANTGRASYTYYKTTLLSTDNRITSIECFRYRNMGTLTEPEYHGTAAFAVFYDDPYLGIAQVNYYEWDQPYGDNATIQHKLWKTEKRAVQNTRPLYDVNEVVWSKPCDCETRAKIVNSHPNICLMVWVGTTLQSTMSHDYDIPMTPFKDEHNSVMNRDKIVYINDYNAAVRWDRLTGDDPVDTWINHYQYDAAGVGGNWEAAPSYNGEKQVGNDPLDFTGRLVASGNNVIYVWDGTTNQRLEYNALTGERITRNT